MCKRLKKKVAIIVGAGSVGQGWGNGKATAVLFSREGANILAVDINLAAAEETGRIIKKEKGVCEVHRADVAQSHEIKSFVDRCIQIFGQIDILVNNVGIVEPGGAADTTEKSWDRVMQINLKSQFLTCKYVLPYMEKQRRGSIINISSVSAIRTTGRPYISYSVSKAGVLQLTQSIALEYAHKNVRCNVILPGFMNTPRMVVPLKNRYNNEKVQKIIEERNKQCPMMRMGDAWDIAYAALFLASDEAKYITGAQIIVDGGLTSKIAKPYLA